MFIPTRAAGLAALHEFAPHAGGNYTTGRNYDLSEDTRCAVSRLSPYIRHRLVTEVEVTKEVLRHHDPKSASKFLQEVFWRTYWKGWLELRPNVWTHYKSEVQAGLNRLQSEEGLRNDFDAACRGETEIECFNYWAKQLVKTGYLHNHARMWFASIWIFTLRLPWALGADFFLRHLLDGDPASNTLGWRWVGGMQTVGKTYLATPDNIETFTRGRFRPDQSSLTHHAVPLAVPSVGEPQTIPFLPYPDQNLRTGMLLHEDDLTFTTSPSNCPTPIAACALTSTQNRSPLIVSDLVTRFVEEATLSQAAISGEGMVSHATDPAKIVNWARNHKLEQVVTAYAPVGPVSEALNALEKELFSNTIRLVRMRRDYDEMCWPKATHGFFRFKESIPEFISKI